MPRIVMATSTAERSTSSDREGTLTGRMISSGAGEARVTCLLRS